MAENEVKREFKGIWIPKEIWTDTRLNALDKIIFAEIDSLDNDTTGCFASNAYLAEFCQCSASAISKAISKLIKLGYIYCSSFDGRTRFLKSSVVKVISESSKIYEADLQNLQVDKNTTNNIGIKIDDEKKSKRKKAQFVPPTFEEVQAYADERGYSQLARKFYDYFSTGNWIDSKGNKVQNWKQKFITWEEHNKGCQSDKKEAEKKIADYYSDIFKPTIV